MQRREFISLLGGAAAAWPLSAHAQKSVKIPRIGIIDDAPIWDHFRRGLREAGYLEIAFEYRSAEGHPERLAAAAKELAAVPVDIIVTSGTAATRAAQQATSTIPIVIGMLSDLSAYTSKRGFSGMPQPAYQQFSGFSALIVVVW
jgi:putative tryptophan/tyrosine transport system substrate-binding protein